jgi:hypothetical protein
MIIIALLIVLVVAMILALYRPGTPAEMAQRLSLAIGYGLAILLFLFGSVILVEIATGNMDLSTLLNESGGGASMSRFQLLIFTFVIALSLFLIVVKDGKFPQVPTEILTLLGISATTYGVSKGIQAGGGLKSKTTNGNVTATETGGQNT